MSTFRLSMEYVQSINRGSHLFPHDPYSHLFTDSPSFMLSNPGMPNALVMFEVLSKHASVSFT